MREPLMKELSFAALDFESAGGESGQNDVPIQVGIAVGTLGMADQGGLHLWQSYIYTERPILWSASKIHGIEKADLAGAPSFVDLWPQLKSLLSGRVIVGHNLGTERRFLREFPGHGFSPWVDTLLLARECVPGLDSYSLEAVVKALSLESKLQSFIPEGRWHQALYDAAGSWLILEYLVEAFDLKDCPLSFLGKSVRF